MASRVLMSLCLMASIVLAKPQNGWQQGQQQDYAPQNQQPAVAAQGYGANGAAAQGGRQLQPQQGGGNGVMKPMNYDFQWEVDNEEYGNYYGHQEKADNGRVDGSYHVWLPNGKLMKVTYYVDGDSGFVPTITYEDNYTPTWGNSYFGRRRR